VLSPLPFVTYHCRFFRSKSFLVLWLKIMGEIVLVFIAKIIGEVAILFKSGILSSLRVFNRVYRLEILSFILVFSTGCMN
jgi:hypothetical protein